MDLNNIQNEFETLRAEHTYMSGVLDHVMTKCGEVRIPITNDKSFKDVLKNCLQHVFSHSDLIDYEQLVNRILVHHFSKCYLTWSRTVTLTQQADLKNQLTSLIAELDTPEVGTLQPKQIHHIMPKFALNALLEQNKLVDDVSELKEQLRYCCQQGYHEFSDEELAHKHGYGLEYQWYKQIHTKIVDEVVSLLHNRAFELYKQLGDKYEPEKYCTCHDKYDTKLFSYQREHKDHGTLPFGDCILSVLQMKESEDWLSEELQRIIQDLYKQCSNK